MRRLKRFVAGLLIFLLVAVIAVAVWVYPREPAPPLPAGTRQPVFEELAVPFTHRWDREHGFHLLGAAVIDVDGDGRDEVFISGGHGQQDALLRYQDGKLIDGIDGSGLSATATSYGATSIDIDSDGDVDLFVARDDGLTLYRNDGKGVFRSEAVPLALGEHSVPLSVAVSDIDHDGDGDLYVSVFIDAAHLRSATYNDPSHVRPNIMLRNDGEAGFKDITDEVTKSKQNTFTSVFVDLDGDDYQDLVIAQNTGQLEILKNVKGRFEAVSVDTGYGFWMGLAIGDFDNDNDPDIFATNAGNSIPAPLTRGDLREDQRLNLQWIMLRNEGEMKFSDVTERAGLTGYGFAWGAAFEDVNLDGRLDLLVAESYIKWPVHRLKKLPGKVLLGVAGEVPTLYPSPAAANPHYGHSPLLVDLDGDGRHDLLWINADGPARAWLNRTDARYVGVRLPDTVAALGARVTLEGTQSHPTWQVTNAVGLTTDPPTSFTFGLGADETPSRIIVTWPGGKPTVVDKPEVNTAITVRAPIDLD